MSSDIELIVAEGEYGDVGRNIVRVPSFLMHRLNIETGDIVEIEGEKKTVARAMRLRFDDQGKRIIRMDGIIRRNAGVTLGDKVKVRRANVKPAKTITFAPVEEVSFRGDVAGYIHARTIDKPFVKGDILILDVLDAEIPLVVTRTNPDGPVIVTGDTEVIFSEKPAKLEKEVPDVTYEDIGGLNEEIKKIREMVEVPMKYPEIFNKLGVSPPKGVLLYGPPGTGKTLLAKALANEINAYFTSINGPEIMSKYYGQSEENLRKIFEEAEKNAPAIIFIDEIDAIAPKREESQGDVEKRVVSQLLTLMDGLKSRGKVVVIGATNRPDAIDPALRRPGRFDREIEIGVPDKQGRYEILQIHTRGMPLDNVDLKKIAEITHGYVGADLEMLCKEAAMKALRRVIPELVSSKENEEKGVLDKIKDLKITMEDFMEAFREMEPSAMREAVVEVPNVHWEDIGGLKHAKQKLKEAVEWPLKYPELFKQAGVEPPKGILLTGPPGTGKTLLAKAVATESEANFISVKGPELLSKWVGESEKGIRKIFKRARMAAPCIIFFDEFDSIAQRRGTETGTKVLETVVNQLLSEMDGIEKLSKVVVIGATNRPDLIDPALLRPGRFEEIIEISLPTQDEREEIFKVHTKNMPLKNVDLKKLAAKTGGMSGADIAAVCKRAGLIAIKEAIDKNKDKIEEISMKHFEKALKEIKKS